MEPQPVPTQSLTWFEMWRLALLRPTHATFTRLANDPKAGVPWGLVWALVVAAPFWLVGPQRGPVVDWLPLNFGWQEKTNTISLVGTSIASILGVLALLVSAGLAHGLARWFGGAGAFRKLFFCWGTTALPFVSAFGLTQLIGWLIVPPSPNGLVSMTRWKIAEIIAIISTLILLYLLYAQSVAFGAVENFGFLKSLGILLLAAGLVVVVCVCFSVGLQIFLINFIDPNIY